MRKEDTKYEKERIAELYRSRFGKRNCVVCIMDSNGSIIKETNYNNTLEQAESFASSIKGKRGGGESTAVCETTGNL